MPAKIDYEKCTGCKKCYDLCPLDCFVWNKETKRPEMAYEDECWHCGICWMDCPKRAIEIIYPASIW